MAKTEIITSNTVSNCSQGTASQFGYAFWAADSLYAPWTPWNVIQYSTIYKQVFFPPSFFFYHLKMLEPMWLNPNLQLKLSEPKKSHYADLLHTYTPKWSYKNLSWRLKLRTWMVIIYLFQLTYSTYQSTISDLMAKTVKSRLSKELLYVSPQIILLLDLTRYRVIKS